MHTWASSPRAPEWDFVTDLTPEQETRIIEVLFDLLHRYLAECEAVS